MSTGSVCPNCGALGDSHDRARCAWTHVAEHWRPPPKPRQGPQAGSVELPEASGTHRDPASDATKPPATSARRRVVRVVLSEHGPVRRVSEGLCTEVQAILVEYGPVKSTNLVVGLAGRRRADVRAALRALEADGRARRRDRGWEVPPK